MTRKIVLVVGTLLLMGTVWTLICLSQIAPRHRNQEMPSENKKFRVQLKSPLYMYTGELYKTMAFVETPEEEEDLKSLACAEGGWSDKHFGLYGMCVFVIKRDIGNLLKTPKVWTENDYNKNTSFWMVNYKQRWYAGEPIHSNGSDLLAWYQITPKVEHYMAENLLASQKRICKLRIPIPIPGIRTAWYDWVVDGLPNCGICTWQESMWHSGEYKDTAGDFAISWMKVCRWRKTESDLWRIFSARPEYNILYVKPYNNKALIEETYENSTLTALLPDDSLGVWGTLPTLLY